MATAATTNDMTLDEIRALLGPLLPLHATFDGWTAKAVASAAADAGVDADIAALAMGDTPMDLITAWVRSVDAHMAEQLPPEIIGAMKIRDKITRMVEVRIDYAARHKEAVRRALAIMAMPQNLRRSAKLNWQSADAMWRLAGDTATDFNHYTKRMTLSAVCSSTLLTFINDESEGLADTKAFLARRIDNVMQFEKAKFDMKKRREMMPSLSRFIGRMRYPA
jgi:ubiquinone biosynthesis protein COQ9